MDNILEGSDDGSKILGGNELGLDSRGATGKKPD